MNMLSFEGKEIETDNDGYLKESSQWSEALAEKIAENEGITLSPEHWEVVRFVRARILPRIQHLSGYPHAGQSHGE